MLTNNKILGLLGLASRARKISFGSDSVEEDLTKRKIKIVVLAEDSSERTKKKFIDLCEKYKIPICIYENIDPVGSCVGQKGVRIQNVINELNGEKIDVIEWNPDPAIFISAALLPAKIMAVDIKEEEKFAQVIVPDDQLSLARGKSGQNARLAARLTNWKIDIKSETQFREMLQNAAQEEE